MLLLPAVLAAGPLLAAKSIVTTGNLSFGRFAAAGGGSISIGVNGTRTRSGGVILLSSPASAARFALTENGQGHDNRIAILTLPPNGSVTLVSGADSMAVNDFVSNHAGNGLPGPATETVSVGATLQVAPNQRPGNYSGSFQVTLEYQ